MPGDAALVAVKQPFDGQALKAGMHMRAHLPAQRCHLFDGAGKACLHTVTNEMEIKTTK